MVGLRLGLELGLHLHPGAGVAALREGGELVLQVILVHLVTVKQDN